MAAIDTNVLVRLVTRDDPAQYEKAQAFVQQHQAALGTWEGSKADFADCFNLATVKAADGRPLGTFDATLGKLDGCLRL